MLIRSVIVVDSIEIVWLNVFFFFKSPYLFHEWQFSNEYFVWLSNKTSEYIFGHKINNVDKLFPEQVQAIHETNDHHQPV